MKKIKSIFALIGIAVLVLLYVLTFVFAIIDDPRTFRLLGTSLAATVIIPTLIWVIGIFVRLSSPANRPEDNTEDNQNNGNNDSEE